MADSCGHDFCHNCLLTIIGEENEWLCPECRSEQSKKPDELMRNRRVERCVEAFNTSMAQNEARSLCSHHNLELSLCKSFGKKNLHCTWKLLYGIQSLNHLRIHYYCKHLFRSEQLINNKSLYHGDNVKTHLFSIADTPMSCRLTSAETPGENFVRKY